MGEPVKPLVVDLYCGLGGFTAGFLAEGYDALGFDIQHHVYGEHHYPAQLVIQDVLTLHGAQFRDATCLVASPPCQFFSYTAMPWTRAKKLAAAVRADPVLLEKELALFRACFRIQREACEASGRHIPLIVENVKGAQPWVGRARWAFGSYYLWGDVPALMPRSATIKKSGHNWSRFAKTGEKSPQWNEGSGHKHYGDWFRDPDCPTRQGGQTGHKYDDGVKHHGSGAVWFDTGPASLPSASPRRKAASAMIAKIPLPLSRHIAAVFRP